MSYQVSTKGLMQNTYVSGDAAGPTRYTISTSSPSPCRARLIGALGNKGKCTWTAVRLDTNATIASGTLNMETDEYSADFSAAVAALPAATEIDVTFSYAGHSPAVGTTWVEFIDSGLSDNYGAAGFQGNGVGEVKFQYKKPA